MKSVFFLFIVFAFAACNNEKSADAPTTATAQVPANTYGFTPAYSFSFVMDSAKNSETVLALWKDWKDGDLSKSRNHFADSLVLFLADGTTMMGLADSLLKNMQDYRNSFSSIDITADAVFGVRSTDKNEDWVAIWGTEVQTSNTGKVDSISVQETWRFNKAGKIDLMFQSIRKGIAPPPPGE